MLPNRRVCKECSEVMSNKDYAVQAHLIICYAFYHNIIVEGQDPSIEYVWRVSYTSLDPHTSRVVVTRWDTERRLYTTLVESVGTVYWSSFADLLDFVKVDIEEKAGLT